MCEWCGSNHAYKSEEAAFWELPDGSRAVEIKNVPQIRCPNCEIVYISEELIGKIENHMMLIDTKKLANSFTYSEFFDQPTLLKKNYFAVQD